MNDMRSKNTEEYVAYRCYDENLVSVNSYIPKGTYIVEDDDYRYTHSYTKIVGESADEFIDVERVKSAFLTFPETENFVYQNPDNYVDAILEWNIKEICLYESDSGEKKKTSRDEKMFSELKPYVENSDKREYDIEHEPKWYLHVIFEESRSIVWKSDITAYFDEFGKSRIIVISDGRGGDIVLDPASSLYQFIDQNIGL